MARVAVRNRSDWPLAASGIVAAAAIGILGRDLTPLVLVIPCLWPVVVHLRWVGVSNPLGVPSGATVVLLFFVLVFPLRAAGFLSPLGIHPQFVVGSVTDSDVLRVVVGASIWTSLFIDGFHRFGVGRDRPTSASASARRLSSARATTVGLVLSGIAVLSLLAIIVSAGGDFTRLASHSKVVRAEIQSIWTTIWVATSTPAVWVCALAAFASRTPRSAKLALGLAAFVIVLAQLAVFGSRLNMIASVLGAWVVADRMGHAISTRAVVSGIVALTLVSIPLLNARSGGEYNSGQSTLQKVSAITGYGMLDISLAVHATPEPLRSEIERSDRWANLPGYIAPSALGFHRGDFDLDRMDAFVVRNFGTPNQQDSGFPMSAVTESWLYVGFFGSLPIAFIAGAGFGHLHRRLMRAASGGAVIWLAFLTSSMFTFYKDGDIFSFAVSTWRGALTLSIILVLSGLWRPWARSASRQRKRRGRGARADA